MLGRTTPWPEHHSPELLCPIARAPQREAIGLSGPLPFVGADVWTAYELSWLTPRGKPQVALAHITVPCESANLIESKSLKLYLGGFAQERYADPADLQSRMRQDLSEAISRGSARPLSVGVQLIGAERFDQQAIHELDGVNLDRLDLDCDRYTPEPGYLQADSAQAPVEEVLCSRLLKSNCPVTGQPDWGSVRIAYAGAPIDQAGLLRYLVSFRQHSGFHESCVERIFCDIQARCRPTRLSVQARYTRRGGIDINPWRASHPQAAPAHVRTARQ